MRKKRICFIAQFPPPIHGLSKAVDTLYHSELNANLSGSGEFEFEKINLTDNKNLFKILYHIAKSKADLFYFTISQTKMGNLRDLIIFKLLELQHKKCLIHLHGGYYRTLIDNDLNKWQRKANYDAVNKLIGAIVLGPSLRPIFYGLLPNEKIYMVPNCVDDQYLISEIEYKKKIKNLKVETIHQVVYLSNFIRSKGYLDVLEMVKMEKSRVDAGGEKKLHFNFAGKFFEKAEQVFFEEYIKMNHLECFVSYFGVVDGQKKLELLKLGSIFVLPTRYPNEGQPISILEGMGNAMMIISTDHAGIPDIVQDHINGILIKKNDNIKTVYKTIISISNKELIQISRKNRIYCKSHFTQMKYLDSMKHIFQKSLE